MFFGIIFVVRKLFASLIDFFSKQAIFNLLQFILICCGVKLFFSPLILIAITPKVIGFIIFK
jgi:hypothetical protein